MNDLRARLEAYLSTTYRLERELGSGGMAVVYLVHDLRHKRRVALKVLRPELSAILGTQRFLREIETLASLVHPHILPLHDSGEAHGLLYFVMPYVEGESLRDRLLREKQLPLEDALRITREVADALSYAHGRGIVHRDIKPENILLSDGHALVADFGIAAAVDTASCGRLTETGFAMGTPAYLSPEQASGQRVDGRSDVYSLGCVLYEMLCGEPPFTGVTPRVVIAKQLSESPVRVSVVREGVGANVDAAIHKALSKTPADRFATVQLFVQTLDSEAVPATAQHAARARRVLRIAGMLMLVLVVALGFWIFRMRSPTTPRSIAVLPCQQVPMDSANDVLAVGVADQIITQLTRTEALRPISLGSVVKYRTPERDLQNIARELRVDAILDCTVRSVNGQVQITVHLVDARRNEQLWAKPYVTDLKDINRLESDVAVQIANALDVKLSGRERRQIARQSTQYADAWREYIRGRYVNGPTEAQLKQSIFHFRRAIDRDSAFAEAYASLADAWTSLGLMGLRPAAEARDSALAAARHAVVLDPQLGQAHAALGWVNHWFEWNWEAAEAEFKQAIRQAPSDPDVHSNYAHFLISMRRFEEAIAQSQETVAINANNPFRQAQLGWAYYMSHRYDEAIESLEATLTAFPEFAPTGFPLAWSYAGKRRYVEALAAAQRAEPSLNDDPWLRASLAYVYAVAGRRTDAERILQDLHALENRRYVDPRNFGVIYGALGQIELALDYLEESHRLGSPEMAYLNVTEMIFYEPLRSHPRYHALVKKMKFPAAPN